MEISQFTYFQQMGSIDCDPVSLELTYGLERLAMFIQNVDNIFDIIWDDSGTTYGDIFKTNEEQMCHYNFQYAPEKYLFDSFASLEKSSEGLIETIFPFLHMNYVLKLATLLIYLIHVDLFLQQSDRLTF